MADDCPQHGERVEAGDPRYDGFRLERLWLFAVVDPADDQEGVIPGPDGLPLFASDERRVEDLRPFAAAFARAHGVRVRLLRFDGLTEVEVFEGGG